MLIRNLHRWVSMPLSIFLLSIILTGIYLQVVEFQHGLKPKVASPTVSSAPDQVVLIKHIERALKLAERQDSGFPTEKIEISYVSSKPIVTLSTRDRLGPTMEIDVETGKILQIARPERTLRTYFLLFHSGKFFGTTGTIIMLLTGIVLLLLCVTGCWEYLKMYQRRRNAGRKSFFW